MQSTTLEDLTYAKRCTQCQKQKHFNCFSKRSASKDGYKTSCKECCKKWVAYNRADVTAQMKQWRCDNKIKIKKDKRLWRLNNIDRNNATIRRWRSANKVRVSEYNRKSVSVRRATDPSFNEGKSRWKRIRLMTCIQFRLRCTLRSRFQQAIKNNHKTGSAVQDLGCSIEELKTYLESKFQPGMTWDNWSLRGWHIDHVVALKHFDLTDREQLLRACHYTNLQPLWAKDNLKKGIR